MTYADWRDAFAQAIDPRFYSIDYLDWLLGTGRARLWANDIAAIVAEVRTFPTGLKAVCGVIAAGDKGEIKRLIPLAEAWGRENGCAFGMIESRPGWEREMREHGYDTFQVSIVKEL